ncbi:MAG: AEC family transporter [Methanocorpusculum sp.]|jgi:predicted permease|nr:AEC family transporter [Methanocorpusculum sp.]MDD3257714.1 AEC family transporter [Methanocorpusculum sp.]
MDYFIALNQILILFLLIGVGYFARRIKILNDTSISSLSKFLLHICIPAMIVYSMQIPFTSDVFQTGEYLVLAAFAYYGIAFLVAWVAPILMRAKKEEYGVFRFMLMFSNSMFMGFPILSMLYGQDAIFYAAIFNIPFTLLTYSIGIWILKAHEKGNGKLSFDPKLLLNPAFLSTILGLVFFMTSISIPDPIYSSLGLLNDITTPLSLVVTGAFLAQLKFTSIFKNVRQYIVAGIRLLAMPAITFAVFSQVITNPLVLGIIVVTAGMPAAVNTVLLAEEHKAHPDIAAQGVCISTLLCLITLPLIAMLLTG